MVIVLFLILCTNVDVNYKCEQAALNTLKKVFCSAPVLAYPDPQEQFIVDTHASDYAVGSVLSQVQNGKERVIKFGLRQFTKSQITMGSSIFWQPSSHFTYKVETLSWGEFNDLLDSYCHSIIKAMVMLACWVYYLEPYRPYMSIQHLAGRLHGNVLFHMNF